VENNYIIMHMDEVIKDGRCYADIDRIIKEIMKHE